MSPPNGRARRRPVRRRRGRGSRRAAWERVGGRHHVRDRIGQRGWRTLHRFTALAWLAGLVHSLGEGTDAGEAWFVAAVAIVVAPALALLAVRMRGLPVPPRREAAS